MRLPATASGGYGSTQDVWTDKAQRGNTNVGQEKSATDTVNKGLVGQSLNGGDLASEFQDAKQGVDAGTRKEVAKDSKP